ERPPPRAELLRARRAAEAARWSQFAPNGHEFVVSMPIPPYRARADNPAECQPGHRLLDTRLFTAATALVPALPRGVSHHR
ncbi:MAG: hypothetical protein ACRDRL_15395, partial [Sciscionella sp.]